MKLRIGFFILSFIFSSLGYCIEKPLIRLGVLAFGTTNWEIAALEQQKSLETASFKLEVHKIANPQAGKIALQGGAVDMIVSDWIWVSRMRATGADYTFYPYSSASGALMVANDSGINKLSDLCSKHLGIAGDELDKNWLLLQALTAKSDCKLSTQVRKSFAAAPLLNQQLLAKNVDAVLNYWHYAALLEGDGYKQLLNGHQILQGLGIASSMPNLGYVFNRNWAEQHKQAVNQFFQITEQARNQMCSSVSAWLPIIPLLKTDNSKTQALLRERYCEGRVTEWDDDQVEIAEKIYALLRSVSGDKLTGEASSIQPNTFWFIR